MKTSATVCAFFLFPLMFSSSVAGTRQGVDAGGAANIRPSIPYKPHDPDIVIGPFEIDLPVFDLYPYQPPLPPSAPQTTTTLYMQGFQFGASCTEAGWTKVDITAQVGLFFHVDDFVGTGYTGPIAGMKSLWCGARPATTGTQCGYATLPGYGNNWNQAWCTKDCITVSGDEVLDVAFDAIIDTEANFDQVTLEYNKLDCGGVTAWTPLETWDGDIPLASYGGAYSIGPGSVRVRVRFQSDIAWSDEDGLFDTDGAVVVDNLVAEDLALEDFEVEALFATSSNDWQACVPPGFGQHMALFSGVNVVQQGYFADYNVSCLWAAISGSTEFYSCGGFGTQRVVPTGNAIGQYIHNEIWSPNIPLVGTGSNVTLQFRVYRDLPIDNLVFYVWHVRTTNLLGCAGRWVDKGMLYYGKAWYTHRVRVGALLDLNHVSMQMALGVVDMCASWCGVKGSGNCHSHAPLFDNIKVYRTPNSPQWDIQDIHQFQDTFSSDGTTTGTARADIAKDLLPASNYAILPGDSAVVRVNDPLNGLATDPTTGGPAVYLYLAVFPAQPGKSGVDVQAPEMRAGSPRFPVVGVTNIASVPWTQVRMDNAFANGVLVDDVYCVDLKDDLFEPGDEVRFFYGTRNSLNAESYAYGSNLAVSGSDISIAAAYASEFSILPLNGGDILYVDGMDGLGAQGYFDVAFGQMGLTPDRYDVRGPSSSVSNRPGPRVTDVATQLNGSYQKIIWDTGDLSVGLGDGTLIPEKSNDYQMINAFLAGLTSPGGVYICGDDFPETLDDALGASAVEFKSSYITFSLTSGDQRPSYGVAPIGAGTAGNAFAGDTWVIYGGNPPLNDFDVMQPTGSSFVQSSYGPAAATNGAEISKITGNAKVLVGGFSFIYIRDDEEDGTLDRARHMHQILEFLGNFPSEPTDAEPLAVNSLSQNYPNPFNPTTTIAFSMKERARVKVDVYNVAGQLVKSLLDETRAAGSYTDVRWDGTNGANQPVSSGVYFYKFVTSNFSQTKKMVLLK